MINLNHVSHITCQVWHVRCHVSGVMIFFVTCCEVDLQGVFFLAPSFLTKSQAHYKFLYLENFRGGQFKLYRAWDLVKFRGGQKKHPVGWVAQYYNTQYK